VGRITRQKGLPYLLRAARDLEPDAQLVLCAGAPDTPEIAAEVATLVEELRRHRTGVVWIEEMLPARRRHRAAHAGDVFVCPSVYEPMGIVNLEAMACEAAVVATATGASPRSWRTARRAAGADRAGRRRHRDPAGPGPVRRRPRRAVQRAARDRPARGRWGWPGRRRAVEHFSWAAIAERTLAVYREAGAAL
jgi:starch synthase